MENDDGSFRGDIENTKARSFPVQEKGSLNEGQSAPISFYFLKDVNKTDY